MGLWECGQSKPRTPNPRKSANKDCPHFHGPNQKESYMKKPRRAVAEWKAPNRDRPPTAGSVGSVVNPAPERETRTRREQGLSTAFHALRAAANEKRANDPKRQKSGTPSGFIIGSGRIGRGAAPKRQNPNEPPNDPIPPRFRPNFDDRGDTVAWFATVGPLEPRRPNCVFWRLQLGSSNFSMDESRGRFPKIRERRVHRNKGTWRDMRSASIVFVRSLLLIGGNAGGFPSAFALNGPACARSMKPREVSVRPTKVCTAAA